MEKENIENKELKLDKSNKKEKLPKVKLPKLDPYKYYEFVSNGKGNLPRGLWKVTGESALIMLEKGHGNLK